MKNLLNEFFNSKSDANKFLEASQQEALENDFQKWFDEKMSFELVMPILIKYMATKHHPHTVAIVSSINAQVFEGIQSSGETYEYLPE